MKFEYVLVGGGLQNAVTALSLLARRPDARIALVERGPRLGGNHVWAFHEGDVPVELRPALEPLTARRWDGYEVRFPGLARTFDAPYTATTSDRLHAVVSSALAARPGCALLLGASARSVLSNEVFLEDGRVLEADVVVDARGPDASVFEGPVAYQKFVGLELALRRPAPDARPTLMDATVPQDDGFRFFYTLPFAPDRVLVEDTYFSDGPSLDVAAIRRGIVAYAAARGFEVAEVLREEVGVLPLPLGQMQVPSRHGPLVAGYQGGWFHPATGYSFPLVARLAHHVAETAPEELFGAGWSRLVSSHERQSRFLLLLNRLLFRATVPELRYRVFERFFRLPEATIGRFFAMRTTSTDRARIVCGRPPSGVSLRAALSQVMNQVMAP